MLHPPLYDLANSSSVTAEPTNRRGRVPRNIFAHIKEESSSIAPLKEAPSTYSAPPAKRGPGRPRKDAAKAAPGPRRTIVQPDDVPPPAEKSFKKRPINDVRANNIQIVSGASKSRFQLENDASAEEVAGPQEPARKKQRRGLTNVFSSPMSSSISPVVETIEGAASFSLPGPVFESEFETTQLGQPVGQGTVGKDTVEVQRPKRRTIVQLDDETVLRNYEEGLT